MNNKWLHLWLLVVSIVFLGNCEFFKKQDETTKNKNNAKTMQGGASEAVGADKVLLSIDGKPVLTVSDYEDYVNTVMAAQPQLKQLWAFMPDLPYELFDQLKKELIVKNWVEANNITQSAEYKKDLQRSTEFLERQLALKYFQEQYPKLKGITVTDQEIRKAYEEQKKTIPQLTISRGGVNAIGVMFEKQADAQEFLNKVKDPGVKFEKAAQDQDLSVKNFSNVNEYTFEIDPQVKDKIMKVTKFPSFDVIKSKDGKFWVVKVTGKEEPKYVPLEEVKEAFRQQLLMQKLFDEELKKIQEAMNIVENKSYFEKMKKERQEELDRAQKQEEDKSKKVQPAPKKSGPQKSAMPAAPVKGT